MTKKPALISMAPLAALLFLLLCGSGAWSFEPLSMKAYQSIGAFHKYKRTLPICVELTNYGPPFRGRIEINNAYSARMKKQIIYRVVELPRNSQKQYFLYIPEFEYYSPSLQVELKALPGKQTVTSATVTIDHVYPKDFLVLVFSKDQAGFEFLNNPKIKTLIGKDAQVSVTYPSTTHLPPDWAGYESADLMILCNYPSLNIPLDQQKAIRDWVVSGGQLFISSSLTPSEFSQSALRDIVPVTPLQTIHLDTLKTLEAFGNSKSLQGSTENPLVVMGMESIKGEVLLREGTTPLLVRKNWGKGVVYYCACDITRPPFTSWSGNIDFWRHIFSTLVAFRKSMAPADDNTPLSSMPQVKPPSRKNLSYFLFVYLLMVGPLNYILLKRKDRMLYTFLTVPVLAVLFTLSSFLFGYVTKGSQVLFRTVSICEVQRELTIAPMTTYFSLFSPTLSHYNIGINNPQAIAWELNYQGEKDFTLQWKEGLLIQDLAMDMWSMRRFKARQVVTFPGRVEIAMAESNGSLRGTINNTLDLKLNNCMLIYKSRISEPFSLKKGGNQIDLPRMRAFANSFELANLFIKSYDIVPDDRELGIKREQMSFLFNFTTTCFAQDNLEGPVLLGWSDLNTAGIVPERVKHRAQESTLFIIR